MFKSPLDLLESGSVVVLWKVVITKHYGVEVLWRGDSPALQPLKICVEGAPCSDTDAVCQAHLPLQINPPFCAVLFLRSAASAGVGLPVAVPSWQLLGNSCTRGSARVNSTNSVMFC